MARRLPPLPRLAVHDFDEFGVPSDADIVWRQRTLGQSPLGEILAAPSAPDLAGVCVCLVDCRDADRIERLRARDGDRWGPGGEAAFLHWAAWMREHHANPQARPDVIRSGGWGEMRWERWSDWQPGDPRWRAHCIDIEHAPPAWKRPQEALRTSCAILRCWPMPGCRRCPSRQRLPPTGRQRSMSVMSVGRAVVAVTSAIAAIAVAGCTDHSATATKGTPSSAKAICHRHFPGATVAVDMTVADARFIGGPRPTSALPGALDAYPSGDRVVRCLVPLPPTSGYVEAKVVDIVEPADRAYVRWQQGG